MQAALQRQMGSEVHIATDDKEGFDVQGVEARAHVMDLHLFPTDDYGGTAMVSHIGGMDTDTLCKMQGRSAVLGR